MKKSHALSFALAVSLVVAMPSAAFAQGPPSTFEECAAVPDDVERLACYDEVATAVVPDTIKSMREAKAKQVKEEFGLFKPEPGQVLDRLPVTVVRVERTLHGKVRLIMEDGAVWVQTDSKGVYYPKTFTGVIKKAMMGSYIFSPDTKDKAIKVERIK